MSLVTVKDKFQVTIPRRVREQVPLAVGDVLEATVEQGVIVLRPKAVVDRAALAVRLERALAAAATPGDAGRPEAEIMTEAIAEIDAVRAARRAGSR
jgi:AbrB family looped-hinge helix DNA binding protein